MKTNEQDEDTERNDAAHEFARCVNYSRQIRDIASQHGWQIARADMFGALYEFMLSSHSNQFEKSALSLIEVIFAHSYAAVPVSAVEEEEGDPEINEAFREIDLAQDVLPQANEIRASRGEEKLRWEDVFYCLEL